MLKIKLLPQICNCFYIIDEYSGMVMRQGTGFLSQKRLRFWKIIPTPGQDKSFHKPSIKILIIKLNSYVIIIIQKCFDYNFLFLTF